MIGSGNQVGLGQSTAAGAVCLHCGAYVFPNVVHICSRPMTSPSPLEQRVVALELEVAMLRTSRMAVGKECAICGSLYSVSWLTMPLGSKYDGVDVCGACVAAHLDPVIDVASRIRGEGCC